MSMPSSPAVGSTCSAGSIPAFSYADMTSGSAADAVNAAYEDALDDVHTRFIINLPPAELSTSDRIFFQLEQAWWFYDDFICDNSEYKLPRFKSLRPFAIKMFKFSPLLSPMAKNFDQMWDEFSAYKRSISNYGTILLNASCTKIVLCQVWNGKTWTFPAGKVNQNEHGSDAGARETYEETGFDPNCQLGRTKQMREEADANGTSLSWKPLVDDDGLVFVDGGKRRTCYVCRGVPEDFPFAPVARKEVSAVEWHDLDQLPKKTFAVLPFINQLKRWIKQNKRSQTPNRKKGKTDTPGRKRSGSFKKPKSRNNSRGKVRQDDPLAESGLAKVGDQDGWTEEDMFKTNEKLLGRKITYDGNPHVFAEKGFDGGPDPHAFHVVGGSFMNSGERKLAPAPDQSKLQPLFRKDAADRIMEKQEEEEGFRPFFSDGGETPWGDVVSEVLAEEAAASSSSGRKDTSRKRSSKKRTKQKVAPEPTASVDDQGQALLNMLRGGGESNDDDDDTGNEVFMTDAEITARSQKEKRQAVSSPTRTGKDTKRKSRAKKKREEQSKRHEQVEYLRNWVKNLPEAPATERFGDFRFDVDPIMEAMEVLDKFDRRVATVEG